MLSALQETLHRKLEYERSKLEADLKRAVSEAQEKVVSSMCVLLYLEEQFVQ